MSTPMSTSADAAREQARQDNGQFGTQPLAEADVDLFDGPTSDYERAHGLADDLVANLYDADHLRDFLAMHGVQRDTMPDDEEALDKMASDLAHQMATDALDAGEVDEFVTAWTGEAPDDEAELAAENAATISAHVANEARLDAAATEDFELTPEKAYAWNRAAATMQLAAFAEDPDDELTRGLLSLSAVTTLSSLRAVYDDLDENGQHAVDRLDLNVKMVDQAELKIEWNAAFAALKTAGLEADSDDPIAVRYREASNAVNHANRKLDFAIATGRAASTDPKTAAGGLAEALQNAIAVGDTRFRRDEEK